ncbi:TPA: hypothetical protein ACH3X1_009199 [Trebouxia sp. C0004]
MVMRWGGGVVAGDHWHQNCDGDICTQIVDNFLDPYSLINGFEASEAHWERKLQRYLGPFVLPAERVLDVGRTPEHMQVRINAWRGAALVQ